MSEYRAAKKRITVLVGQSIRIIRELQELSQNQLSQLTGIPQATISAIENDRALCDYDDETPTPVKLL